MSKTYQGYDEAISGLEKVIGLAVTPYLAASLEDIAKTQLCDYVYDFYEPIYYSRRSGDSLYDSWRDDSSWGIAEITNVAYPNKSAGQEYGKAGQLADWINDGRIYDFKKRAAKDPYHKPNWCDDLQRELDDPKSRVIKKLDKDAQMFTQNFIDKI